MEAPHAIHKMDKLIEFTYLIIFLTGLIMTGSKADVLIKVGLILLAVCFAFMTYFRIRMQSRYPWGVIYFLRIAVVTGLGVYLLW